jgi:aspartyl protease family protein
VPIAFEQDWQQLALYAVVAAVVLMVLSNLPYVGKAIRSLVSVAFLAFALFVLFQQAPYDPNLSRLAGGLGLQGQQVVGEEVRIPQGRDGHFWAEVEINGVARRMVIDSGATITALSTRTAAAVDVDSGGAVLPVILQTANGTVAAETGSIETLRLGGIAAHDLKVVVTPALGGFDLLGMNFLSQLESWRVERGTLILVPAPREGDTGPG